MERSIRQCPKWLVLALVASVVGVLSNGRAGEPADPSAISPAEARAEFPRLLRDLDSPDYAARQRAAATFEQWIVRPELGSLLAEQFQRLLLDPQTSYEIRWQAERWARRLPPAALPAVEKVSDEQLDCLVRLADDNSFAAREGAKQRIRWWLQSPSLAAPLMLRLKQQLRDPALTSEKREYLEPLYEEARGAWLLSDPAGWKLPPVTDTDLARWIEQLQQPAPASLKGPWNVHVQAERELLDVLARDDQVGRVKGLLEARLAALSESAAAAHPGPALDAAARLRAVLDWTRPELVAEYWSERRHLGEQHLLVGVATFAEGATAPSHFDRIDDHTAHCVSGATLSPGDYPALEAFPHPNSQTAFFHLVNLPTPRRRMAYAYYVRRDPAVRLAEISRRTLDRWLERKKAFSFREAVMLKQLDPREVSRFAGRYFLLLPDAPLTGIEDDPFHIDLQPAPSRHTMLCLSLIDEGTHEAIGGLLQAIEKNRFRSPSPQVPYRAAWCAALAIAHRDPWPEVDRYLAGLVARNDDMAAGVKDGPQWGATAAAILLARHGQDPQRMGLVPAGTPWGKQAGIDGFRFRDSQSRAAIESWWQESRQPAASSQQ